MNSDLFPNLCQFMSAYFHEDWMSEFEQADDIIKLYLSDSSPEAVSEVRIEITMLLANQLPEADLQNFLLSDMGCCYCYWNEWPSVSSWLKHVLVMINYDEKHYLKHDSSAPAGEETIEQLIIRDFFGAYFHQDWTVEHETAEDVIDAFIVDSDINDLNVVRGELNALLSLRKSELELREYMLSELSCYYCYWNQWGSGEIWLRHIVEKMSSRV